MIKSTYKILRGARSKETELHDVSFAKSRDGTLTIHNFYEHNVIDFYQCASRAEKKSATRRTIYQGNLSYDGCRYIVKERHSVSGRTAIHAMAPKSQLQKEYNRR